jgi:hypothetical protein
MEFPCARAKAFTAKLRILMCLFKVWSHQKASPFLTLTSS